MWIEYGSLKIIIEGIQHKLAILLRYKHTRLPQHRKNDRSMMSIVNTELIVDQSSENLTKMLRIKNKISSVNYELYHEGDGLVN